MQLSITRVAVDSSSLAAVGYSQQLSILEAEFRSGCLYRYFYVPAAVFEEFKSAPSKGRYFNQHIKDVYPFERAA